MEKRSRFRPMAGRITGKGDSIASLVVMYRFSVD